MELSLPTPTGLFVVGRTIYDWIDDVHGDAMAPVPGTKRELLVWIWYLLLHQMRLKNPYPQYCGRRYSAAEACTLRILGVLHFDGPVCDTQA